MIVVRRVDRTDDFFAFVNSRFTDADEDKDMLPKPKLHLHPSAGGLTMRKSSVVSDILDRGSSRSKNREGNRNRNRNWDRDSYVNDRDGGDGDDFEVDLLEGDSNGMVADSHVVRHVHKCAQLLMETIRKTRKSLQSQAIAYLQSHAEPPDSGSDSGSLSASPWNGFERNWKSYLWPILSTHRCDELDMMVVSVSKHCTQKIDDLQTVVRDHQSKQQAEIRAHLEGVISCVSNQLKSLSQMHQKLYGERNSRSKNLQSRFSTGSLYERAKTLSTIVATNQHHLRRRNSSSGNSSGNNNRLSAGGNSLGSASTENESVGPTGERNHPNHSEFRPTSSNGGGETSAAAAADIDGDRNASRNSSRTEGPDRGGESRMSAMSIVEENRSTVADESEIRNVEEKVHDIAHMMNELMSKIADQADQIDNLYDEAVESTENVREGNEELMKAIENGLDLKLWVFVFLLTCSFSLLFLDMYS